MLPAFAKLRSSIGDLFRRGQPDGLKAEFIPADPSSGSLPRTRYPYARSVGEGLDSNVVMAPVNWIVRNFTAADVVMDRRDTDLRWSPVGDHAVLDLLHRPNEFYSGTLLWKALLVSYVLDGNGYWLKVRNVFGQVVELWYLAHFLVEPRWPRDGSVFLSHYDYRPTVSSRPIQLAPRDVIHFRNGLDPRNPRKGMSQLRPLLREVFTDDEAANFSASILRNMGVPGGMISPSKGSEHLPGSGDTEELKEYMRNQFTGDKRGEWLVLGVPTDVQKFGFNPQELSVSSLRDIAEERVCAALGIPAAVVGFGSGLQQTKVGATMKELRRLAWTSCLQPMGDDLTDELDASLVPDFVSQTRRFRTRYDVSGVPAFAEEEAMTTDRILSMVEGSVLRVDRAQEALGLEVDETQAGYIRTGALVMPGKEPVPPPIIAPSANGDGGEEDDEGGDLETRAAALLANGRR